MAITINDIAKKAGVSLATVSRVLNNSPHVSKKMRKKVLDIIEELNYIPSAYARSLSMNKSTIIGVIGPEISNQFFSEIIKGITSVADASGLSILLFNTDENAEKEAHAIRLLQEYRVQGLIITPVTGVNSYDKDYVQLFNGLNIPFVLMDRSIKNSNFDGIYFDDTAAIFNATKLLIENGHRNIKIFVGNPDHIVSVRRIQGFTDAMNAYDISFSSENILTGEFSIQSSYEITRDLILAHNLPTAFIGITNMISMGCLKALYQYGISIPDEIAFVGYDGLQMLDVLNLNLTLVEKDPVEMGRRAAKLLLEKIQKKQSSMGHYTLMPTTFVRGSEKFPWRNPNLRTFPQLESK